MWWYLETLHNQLGSMPINSMTSCVFCSQQALTHSYGLHTANGPKSRKFFQMGFAKVPRSAPQALLYADKPP